MSGKSGRVLVLNSGSSSIKYQVFAWDGETLSQVHHGLVERIGEEGGPQSHRSALGAIADDVALSDDDMLAIGHRVVHGGEEFREPTLITDAVIGAVERLTPLAPLHNPHNLAGIEEARRLRPDLPQVAVFDTAFHATMPESAYRYAIEVETADKHGIRRYGFHGTSHRCVSRGTAELLGRPIEELAIVTLHLGNGASACAVRGGRSVETSMGLSPLEGLVMGTRSGDIDPAIIGHLYRNAGMSIEDVDQLLNKRSGLRGLSGHNDLRPVLAARAEGDASAERAVQVYCHRIRKYVGAYPAVLGGADAVTFTAGVGENSPEIRAESLAGLEALGIVVDPERNARRSRRPRVISPDGAPVAVCVVPTNEELEIATQTLSVTHA